MSSKMRAAKIEQYNEKYKLGQVPIPECGDYSLLIRVYAAGFCHSDVQVLHGQFPVDLPMIPSHEPAGKIVKIGSKVQGNWNIGDRVGVLNFQNACGVCSGCRQRQRRSERSDPRFCERRRMAGFKHDGAFAQYMLADPETTIQLPEQVSFAQGAPLMCAGATAWGALSKLKPEVKVGEAVGIVGIGGVGHLAVQYAKAVGYRTVAIDYRQEGCDLALEVPEDLKPDLVVNSSKDDADTMIHEFTSGEGLSGIVVCADSTDINIWSLRQLGNKAIMVPLGLPKGGWQFDAETVIFREISIKGSYVASADEVTEMLEVVAKHGIKSHLTIVDFEEIPNIVDRYLAASIKGRLVVQIAQHTETD